MLRIGATASITNAWQLGMVVETAASDAWVGPVRLRRRGDDDR